MRAHSVVVIASFFDFLARMPDGSESIKVQAFVPEFAVEAFDESVLH